MSSSLRQPTLGRRTARTWAPSTPNIAEVIDKFGNPIPGLYATGNVQGGRFAVDYPTIVCGISHSSCLTYGRIAGTEAATYDPSVTEYPSIYREWKQAQAAETDAAANDTTGVDAVSGATITSSAIFTAVEDCLAQAGK